MHTRIRSVTRELNQTLGLEMATLAIRHGHSDRSCVRNRQGNNLTHWFYLPNIFYIQQKRGEYEAVSEL